jgi:hypothetical protein
MNCCSNCFNDKEIKGFISDSKINGDCDFCGDINVAIVNCKELDETFEPVISVFELEVAPSADAKLMHEKIQELWKVFNVDSAVAYELLISICESTHGPAAEILTKPVQVRALINQQGVVDIHSEKWENFANEIKFKNRFFLTETIELKLLESLLANFSKQYDSEMRFYRARVSDRNGFAIDQMGKPPAEKSTAGRANPVGIPYLYVTTKMETAMYESRSSYLDFICIAEVKLTEDITVVSLREIASASPFVFGDQLEYYLLHQRYMIRLEQELSRPVRRFDKELDYLPSQYLCEFVKSLGYDAIEYSSSLHPGGINLAVFNDGKLAIEGTSLYEVASVDLKVTKIEMNAQ